MVKRKNKTKKDRVIEFDFGNTPDIISINDFFNQNLFSRDFEEIFQRMNNLMENVFRQSFSNNYNNQILIEPEEDYIEDEQELEETDYEKETDARIVYVSPDKLPRGGYWRALGIYIPYLHTIFIANNLPPKIEKFVYYHEVAHSKGIIDEEEADKYATRKCGYYIDLGRKKRRPIFFKYFY